MKSIMHTMMMQSTKTAELMAQLRLIHLEVENQLQLLRAKIQQHEKALHAERSNGAAARTDVQLANKRTMTSPLPDVDQVKVVQVDQDTATSPLPALYPVQVPVQVLQATAYAVDEVRDNDNSLNPPKKEVNNAWLNFCRHMNNDSTHKEFSAALTLGKKSKYTSAVWNTLTEEEKMPYKIKDPARWPPLPAPCADNLAKALVEDGTPAEKAPETQHKREHHFYPTFFQVPFLYELSPSLSGARARALSCNADSC